MVHVLKQEMQYNSTIPGLLLSVQDDACNVYLAKNHLQIHDSESTRCDFV